MKIAIIVPMPQEAEFYEKHFQSESKEMFGSTEFEHFSLNGNDIYLGLSGIGKVNAAMNLASLLTKEKIDLIFMTGSAGSLQDNVHRKDLILPNKFMYHDAHNTNAGDYVEGQIPQEPAGYVLDSDARNKFKGYLTKNNVDFKEGMIVTGDSFISSQEQKDAIKKNFPDALGVEMEGAAFAQVANHFNTPLVAMRAISDNGDENADNDFDKFVKEVGQKAAEIISSYLEENVLD
ncbi:5'-methylthioadenosine/adenosylhomocysteine nucleosidase [Lactobacillus hominis]|uniref:adenosylhomocysteine nucleosidase n=1 Tax=Lactobacillus hominis DSM 23910 = CRBIP 24.179 TaxID=1423758 RepID=I7KG42_9LACO|nr:5'-methylthioadenosine/adenosylhomocysteine nucleosidase [Lactobacillus hominis]KRM86127.1 nucleoside phosphorylase [Lactobacillus hominis DSM 23910 = CRBIP 24.179]MCT3348651.1 5'-methylthioadenosine/adenosylhomocysteine nucleosidase [Lactobacillus hominis]CCI80915.1 5-methylthioadenosine nucleosidase / S-adenosylhomocysteine nucleosidase [Lactobacillus hominis DSM 23910 = CRBIP 24.179]